MNAADVQFFSQIARSGSLSEAANRMGVTRSAASKAMTRLENDLGVVLLRRSTRKLSLTDAGRRFFEHAAEVDNALQNAQAAIAGYDQAVVGNLSVSTSTSLGAALMPRIIRKFRAAWPRLTLSLDFNDRHVDLIGGNVDLAIRVAARLDDSSLMSRSLGTTREILVASPGYVKKFGTPRHVNELKDHHCLDIGGSGQTRRVWRFFEDRKEIEIPVTCDLTTTSYLPLILAACLDEGILKIPEILVSGEITNGRLVEVLPDFADSRSWGIYALYPTRNPPAKIQAFVDFVIEELPFLATADRWSPCDDAGDDLHSRSEDQSLNCSSPQDYAATLSDD